MGADYDSVFVDAVSELHGSRCLVCESVEDPVLCNNVENCEAHEVCS